MKLQKNIFTATRLRPFHPKPAFALLLPAHNNFLSFNLLHPAPSTVINYPQFSHLNCNYYSTDQNKKGSIYYNSNSSWHNYISKAHYEEISVSVLEKELEYFMELFKNEFKQKYFLIMFKIKFDNGDYRSCSTVQTASIYDFDILFTSLSSIFTYTELKQVLSEKEEIQFFSPISGLPVGNIIFSFKPMNNIKNTKYEGVKQMEVGESESTLNKSKSNPLFKFKHNGYVIPNSMDLSIWPNIKFLNDFRNAFAFNNLKSGNIDRVLSFIISINNLSYDVTVLLNNKEIFTFKDESLNVNKDLSTFKRTIFENKIEKVYIFESGKLKFYTEEIKTKFIKPIKKDLISFDKSKILTLDLETRAVKNSISTNGKNSLNFYPTVMSIFDGNKPISFIFNLLGWEAEMVKAFQTIMKRKFDGYTIYTHNFSYFDSIFIMDVLSRMGKVIPFMRDGKILRLTFKFKLPNTKRNYTLYFMDSLLMLPSSLDKLSKSFNIDNKKGCFPHSFLDDDKIDLDYIGKVPSYKFFPNTNTDSFTYEDYIEYINNFKDKPWILKNELVKYCENDTVALYQILIKFRHEIYMKFRVDFTKYPTIPSLAFAIYRSNFLKDGVIPIIQSKLHRIIKQSYFGGITEFYVSRGININSYDINSLYPHSMKSFPMPTGKPVYVKGNLKSINEFYTKTSGCGGEIPFGFYNVKIKAPNNLDKPFIPKRIKTSNGMRTIFPIGEWNGWYFSEEIINGIKHGYSFEFKEGYLFDKTYLFDDYINILYDIKMNIAKDDPWYYISKLLMNSLYGRFGLNPEGIEVIITSEEEADKIVESKSYVNITPLLSGNVLVSFEKNEDDFTNMNISVPISSAIAAYSRVTMSHYLTKYSKNIYYIDTDGIKTDCKIDNLEIDSKTLGKMKYEYSLSEFVAVGPKVYGGVLSENDKYTGDRQEIVKIKGYRSILPFDELKKVLNRNNPIKLQQRKWKRKLSQSTIIVSDEAYTLSLTEGKRKLIFNPWGDLVGTAPLKIINDSVVGSRGVGDNLMFLENPYLFKN